MTNVIQFPTVETAMIDPSKPSKVPNFPTVETAMVDPSKRTLNDVSPNEWDRVAAQSYKNNPIKMK